MSRKLVPGSRHSLAFLAELVGGKLHGCAEQVISDVAPLHAAVEGSLSFLANRAYVRHLADTKASAVILTDEDLVRCKTSAIVHSEPYYAYSQIAKVFQNSAPVKSGVHPSAVVSESANLAPDVFVGPNAVIGERVSLASGVSIGPGSVVGDDVKIGANSCLAANVTLYSHVQIGERCTIHAGAVIGADGFGFAHHQGRWHKVPQLGGVTIGDDVDIGAGTSIDCGSIEDTIIGHGVILDNQIQLGHNVQVGEHTAIAGATKVAGSAKIGRYCVIGGGCGINGHIEIVDGAILTGGTNVMQSIREPGVYASATNAMSAREWKRVLLRLPRLESLFQRLKKVEKMVETEHV